MRKGFYYLFVAIVAVLCAIVAIRIGGTALLAGMILALGWVIGILLEPKL